MENQRLADAVDAALRIGAVEAEALEIEPAARKEHELHRAQAREPVDVKRALHIAVAAFKRDVPHRFRARRARPLARRLP